MRADRGQDEPRGANFATLILSISIMSLFKLSKQQANGRVGHLPANLRDQTVQSKIIVDNIEDGVVLIDDQGVI